MTARNVQIVLLCEDSSHEVFARRFLEKMGWSTRRLRIVKGSGRGGSAVQFVRERFPKELAAYRSKRNHVGQALIVVWDGDNPGARARLMELDGECESNDFPPRDATDRVAVFIPTWRMETWFAYLNGETVDEKKKDYPELKHLSSDCQTLASVLVRMCRDGELREPRPPSLEAACDEYTTRLKDLPR